MYLLRCPQGHDVPVSPTAAGSQVACPQCGALQDVPSLGGLRSLPRIEPSESPRRRRPLRFGARILFATLLLSALATGITSAYAALRWRSLPVPATLEDHIQADQAEIAQLPPAALVTVWDMYEDMPLAEPTPFPYQRMHNLRDSWKRVCLGALAITGLCVAAAAVTVALGRQPSSAGDT